MAKKKKNNITDFLKNMSKRERWLAIALVISLLACAGLATELYYPTENAPTPPSQGYQHKLIQSDGIVSLDDAVNIYFIDVGQGESIFIELPDGRNMLIDAGRGSVESNQFTEEYLLFFAEHNIAIINYLLLTHLHADHCNMLDDVIEALVIETFYYNAYPLHNTSQTYLAFYNAALAEEGAEHILFDEDGDVYYIESEQDAEQAYKITIFAPGYANPELETDPNAHSPICILEYGGRRLLFGGDATSASEQLFISWLASEYPECFDIDVLKVSHHGSKGSTSTDMLDYFTPEYAVISCGEVNTYEHPSPMLMNRLFNYGIVTYRTNRHGTILLSIDIDGDMQFSSQFYAPPENNRFDIDTLYASKPAED